MNLSLLQVNQLENSFRAVYENTPAEDKHKRARIASCIAVLVISAIGDIPFIPVSLPIGKVGGPICAAANAATFFVVDYWSMQGIIQNAFGPKTVAEKTLNASSKNHYRTLATMVFAFVMSMLAQVPSALATMKYNSSENRIGAGLMSLIGGSLLPVRSLQLSLEQILLNRKQSREAQVQKIRDTLTGQLSSCHETFIRKSYEDKLQFINEYKALSSGFVAQFNTGSLAA